MTSPRPRPKLMTITDSAANRIRELAVSQPETAGLRVGIKKGGCAGMEYSMNWAVERDKFDEVVEDNGVQVLVEPTAVMYLLGTVMDFQQDKLSSGFVFNNPNQQGACGCGESVELVPVSKDKLEELKG